MGKEGFYHKAARRLQKAVPDEAQFVVPDKECDLRGPALSRDHSLRTTKSIWFCPGAQGARDLTDDVVRFGNVDRVLRQVVRC